MDLDLVGCLFVFWRILHGEPILLLLRSLDPGDVEPLNEEEGVCWVWFGEA